MYPLKIHISHQIDIFNLRKVRYCHLHSYFSGDFYENIQNFSFLLAENEIFTDDEWSLLRRSKGDRRGWVKI